MHNLRIEGCRQGEITSTTSDNPTTWWWLIIIIIKKYHYVLLLLQQYDDDGLTIIKLQSPPLCCMTIIIQEMTIIKLSWCVNYYNKKMLWDNTHYYFYYDYHSYQYNIFDTGNTQKGQQSIVFLLVYIITFFLAFVGLTQGSQSPMFISTNTSNTVHGLSN